MSHDGNTVVIHAALTATICDVPATAKLSGFVSHTSKMLVGNVPNSFLMTVYSNVLTFLELNYVCRSTMRTNKMLWKHCLPMPSQRNDAELRNGRCFTIFMDLYYDCPLLIPCTICFLGSQKEYFNSNGLKMD